MSRGRAYASRRGVSPYRLFTFLATIAGIVTAYALRLTFDAHWLLAFAAGVNVATVVLYAYDKAAATRTRWLRVPEGVLHAAALLGGTPAALLMQQALRHKTIKPKFLRVFFGIVALQVLAVAALAVAYYRGGIRF